jgi:hypothetical protein
VNVTVRAPLSVTGRVVEWPAMTPAGGVAITAIGPVWHDAAPTTEDGRFRLDGLSPGTIELYAVDVGGKSEHWMRPLAPAMGITELGDLAFVPGEQGYGFGFDVDGTRALVTRSDVREARALGLKEGDVIVSVSGSPVATLSPGSLDTLLLGLGPDAPVVVRRAGQDGTVSLHRMAASGQK